MIAVALCLHLTDLSSPVYNLFDIPTISSQLVHQMLMEVAANELGQKPPSNLRMKMKIVSAKPSFLPSPRLLAMGVWKVQSDNSIPTTDQETLSEIMLSRAMMAVVVEA